MTSAKLRRYAHEQAHRPEWGDAPPLWHTAMTQADWMAEAHLIEIGVPDPNEQGGSPSQKGNTAQSGEDRPRALSVEGPRS